MVEIKKKCEATLIVSSDLNYALCLFTFVEMEGYFARPHLRESQRIQALEG
jgi:hypothetical protein